MKKVGIICQARLTSKRFPNKALYSLKGKPSIQWHLDKICGLGLPVVVAIPNTAPNQPLEYWLLDHGYKVFKDSEDDVLFRYLQCATEYGFEVIIRTCADSIFISRDEIAHTLEWYNTVKRLCVGVGVQIFSYNDLREAARKDWRIASREHVWPWMQHTIDYPEDVKDLESRL